MKLRRLLEGAGALALVLAAGAAQAQMSDGVIKIGILNDRSGIYADLGGEGSVVAAKMAAEEFGNAIDGVPIEIVSADHQNKADVASGIARQWIDTEQVDMIADVPNSAAALAVQEVTRESNRIFIITGAAATDLTGKACSPTSFHWAYDTRALAVGTGGALVAEGGKSWFFITADYAFGHALERDTTAIIEAAGGEVLGSVAHPLATADFSSFLLQAQSSGAQVVGLANAGGDTTNAIKQAAEFGIVEGGQRLAGLLVFISDVHALGLETAQGLVLTTGFYWDLNDRTREWSKRFFDLHGAEPTMDHAGIYSGVRHYLQAIKDLGTDDPTAVAAKMHETPVNDMFAENAAILPNGRLVHDMYLVQVKTPEESAYPWDYYKILRTIPGSEAYFTMEESGCVLPQ